MFHLLLVLSHSCYSPLNATQRRLFHEFLLVFNMPKKCSTRIYIGVRTEPKIRWIFHCEMERKRENAAGGEYFVSILANKALKQKNMRIKERLAMIKWWYHFHFIQWKNKRNPNSLTESANKWTKDWRVFKWELFMRLLSVFVDRWMFHEDSLPTMTSVGLRKIYCMAHNTNEKKYAVIIYVLTLNAPNQ